MQREGRVPPISARMESIEPFRVMEIVERARQIEASGSRVIHMEIGQPDFPTPSPVLRAAEAAMRTRSLGYTTTLGLPELREAISRWYSLRYGIDVPARRIVVTNGASGAFLLAAGVLVNPGDQIFMADPGYPCYRNFVRLFGGLAVPVPAPFSQAYQLRDRDIGDKWGLHSRGVIIASPSNPTGTLCPLSELATILSRTRTNGGFLIVDEIYQGLTYDGPTESALTLGEDVIVINSFSKYFCMTGWRVGWMVVPDHMLHNVEKLAQNIAICPSAPAQYAALAAFDPKTIAILEDRRVEFRRRRDYLVPALEALGFSVGPPPPGAFYVYAGLGRIPGHSAKLCMDLLERVSVAATPGVDFGDFLAGRHLRFAYTRPLEELQEGVERMASIINIA